MDWNPAFRRVRRLLDAITPRRVTVLPQNPMRCWNAYRAHAHIEHGAERDVQNALKYRSAFVNRSPADTIARQTGTPVTR